MNKQKKKKNKKNVELVEKLDENIEVLVVHFKKETFDTLVSDGFMIPTKEQLTALGIIAEG